MNKIKRFLFTLLVFSVTFSIACANEKSPSEVVRSMYKSILTNDIDLFKKV